MSAMRAWAPTMMPPAPAPWIARKATSCPIEADRPHSTLPARNRTMADWKTRLRP